MISDVLEKDDRMLDLKLDARRWAFIPGLNDKIIEAMLKAKYPKEEIVAPFIASQAIEWASKFVVGSEIDLHGIKRRITNIEDLSKRFAQIDCGDQSCVTVLKNGSMPIADKDFEKRVGGEVVILGIDKHGEVKFIPAKKVWHDSINKCLFKKVVFTGDAVDAETYNLFPGFGVKPKRGCCDLIIKHVHEVLCCGDKVKSEAFLNLLAWQIQNVGKPSRIIVALKSTKQQTGKSSFVSKILAPIYGKSAFVTSDNEKVFSRFNMSLKGKALVFLDEALFSKDKKVADAIKSLVTAEEVAIEPKGIDSMMLPIAVNLFLATNHDDAAFLEPDDKRYWILDVSDHRSDDFAYFDALFYEVENGGREAFMHFLMNLNVKSFLPSRDVPRDNSEKHKMIENAINPYSAHVWLKECCVSEMILGLKHGDQNDHFPYKPWTAEMALPFSTLFAAYRDWTLGVRSGSRDSSTGPTQFATLLNDLGFEHFRTNSFRYRSLSSPEVCLKRLGIVLLGGSIPFLQEQDEDLDEI